MIYVNKKGNAMIVYELKRLLEDFDDDAEVRLASQPGWPMEYHVNDAIWVGKNANGTLRARSPWITEMPYNGEESEEEIEESEDFDPGVIYLVEGEQIGYLPEVVKDELGW